MITKHVNIAKGVDNSIFEGKNVDPTVSPLRLNVKSIVISNNSSEEATVSVYMKTFNSITKTFFNFFVIKNVKIPSGVALSVIDEELNTTDEFSLVVSSSQSCSCRLYYNTLNDDAFVKSYKNNTAY